MANGTSPTSASPDRSSKFKIDFIDPLFAVAIHIGFVEGLLQEEWWRAHTLPLRLGYVANISMFLAGLWTLVASWLGYHTSIADKPIKGDVRFVLDIALLVFYIFLLLSFRYVNVVAVLMWVIYVIYVLWDYFKTLEYPDVYYESGGAPWIDKYLIRCFDGWWNPSPTDKLIGGVVNFGWTAFFLFLIPFSFSKKLDSDEGKLILSGTIILATMAYRYDKRNRGFWICLVPVKLIMLGMCGYGVLFLADVLR